MTGPHQAIICSFTGTGQGAAAWKTPVRVETSYLVRYLLRQLQHAYEVGGHELGRGDLVLFDLAKRVLGVEPLHDHNRAA